MGGWHARILHIEDNPGDAALVGYLLDEPEGGTASVARAERLADGLSRLDGESFDLLLLDLDLPDSAGLDTVAKARASAPDVPIIVLSSHGGKAVADGAMLAGARSYLVKGEMSRESLTRAIGDAIRRPVL